MRKIRRLGPIVLFGVIVGGAGDRAISSQATAGPEVSRQFIGAWRNASRDRSIRESFRGLLYYDATGYMAAQSMPDRQRPKYAGAQPTPEEARAAILGYTAYFGRYTIDARAGTITHHKIGGVNPGEVGEDAVRRYEFDGPDRLLLTPMGRDVPIVWERLK